MPVTQRLSNAVAPIMQPVKSFYSHSPTKRKRLQAEEGLAVLRSRAKNTYLRDCRIMFWLAFIGIAIVVVQNELLFENNNVPSTTTNALKYLATASTIALIFAIYMKYRHIMRTRKELKADHQDSSLWNSSLLLSFMAEVFICKLKGSRPYLISTYFR